MSMKCDLCRKPATHGVQDIRQVTERNDAYHRYEQHGTPRFRCDDHHTEPVMYNKDGRIFGRLPSPSITLYFGYKP